MIASFNVLYGKNDDSLAVAANGLEAERSKNVFIYIK